MDNLHCHPHSTMKIVHHSPRVDNLGCLTNDVATPQRRPTAQPRRRRPGKASLEPAYPLQATNFVV
ncbi:hypothetical protein FRACA_3820002 [Frankia canadensis]|uniref:Uncharacterized protein n=1 Tax=Frankia canadensis TaxID=1836972 RepID=A0A2I2KW29_9ACTN|nr:hypothetical protein FRACA_3820002 [Frankia canadensis]SOU57154.1 hypothetical protein FRACA_3820002 [Frankia canadensis]